MDIGSYCSLVVTLIGTGVPGSTVTVRAAVGNLTGVLNYFWTTVDASGIGDLDYQDPRQIYAGSGYTWVRTFTMPSSNCTVTVYAWYWDTNYADPYTGEEGRWVVDISEVKVINVVGEVTPTLTCTSSLKTGDVLSFSFTGFTPNAQVWVGVVGGGGVYVYASSLGAGSGSFVDGDPAGSYTLRASDDYGKVATASFTVTAVQTGWVLLSTVNTVATHTVVLTGWQLLSTVNVSAIHSANLLGWVLLNTVNVQAVHTANLLGWQLLSTVNATAVHTANLLGWVLLSTVNTTAVHKTGEGPTPPPPTTPSWLVPAAIVAVALASQQSTKKVGVR